MKSVITLLALVLFLGTGMQSFAEGGKYKLNNTEVDAMFSDAQDMTETVSLKMEELSHLEGYAMAGDDNTQLIAGLVALVAYVYGVGILIPIHRLILGTGSSTGKIIALYCVTLGGCGFLPLVDGILLLIDDTDKYIGSEKFLLFQE